MDHSGKNKLNKRLELRMARKWPVLILIPIGVFLYSFTIGKYKIQLDQLFNLLYQHYFGNGIIVDKNMETVLFNIRLPRIITVLFVGAGLSVAGAAYQGMFKNPLVSPDILGASAGAGFGAALALYLSLSVTSVQIFAFLGGLLSVFLSSNINRSIRYDPLLGLVLGGMLIGTLFNSGVSIIKILADADNKLPAITFWLMGSFASVNIRDMKTAVPIIACGCIILFFMSWKLNVMSFGEEEAKSMGVNTKLTRRWVIIAATLITAASVSISGMIGWVGLVIPHLCRSIVGPNYKVLLPMCAITGSSFLLLVDNIARCTWTVELPIGVLTALLGVPFFLIIFHRNAGG